MCAIVRPRGCRDRRRYARATTEAADAEPAFGQRVFQIVELRAYARDGRVALRVEERRHLLATHGDARTHGPELGEIEGERHRPYRLLFAGSTRGFLLDAKLQHVGLAVG